MAVRQYVGARYVPKFADPVAWQSGTSYEALTIVTYNNSSYTSKIPVPATVGNPADNDKYWALTGNYNAQVEAYRKESVGVREELTQAQSDLANETQARKNEDTTLQGNILKSTAPTSVLLIGDSYGTGYSPSGTNVSYFVRLQKYLNTFGKQAYIESINTSGFSRTDYPFINAVNEAITLYASNANDIKHIYICGGYNDAYASFDSINAGVAACCTALRNTFVNTPITLVFVSMNRLPDTVPYETLQTTSYNYYLSAINNNCTFADISHNLAKDEFIDSDNIHPTQLGQNILGEALKALISGYDTNMQKLFHSTGIETRFILPDGWSKIGAFNAKDNVTTFTTSSYGLTLNVPSGTTLWCDGQANLAAGSIQSAVIHQIPYGTIYSAPAIFQLSNGTFVTLPTILRCDRECNLKIGAFKINEAGNNFDSITFSSIQFLFCSYTGSTRGAL